MRIGIVCPYSFDVPGGVQIHVRDLADYLIEKGHSVSVLAPADSDTDVPTYVTGTGRATPVRYNGSVARLSFGFVTARRTRRWLSEGAFDVLHIHEPLSPSVGMLALWLARGPIVATFHSSQQRSRVLQIAYPLLRSSLEKITARIAVSEDARRTVVEHVGGDAVIIPNGVDVEYFENAEPDPRWTGTAQAPTFAFLGRIDEPRKGLSVFLGAIPTILESYPGARFFIAGTGDQHEASKLPGGQSPAVEFLGPISDAEKASLLSSVYAYIAPQTGGESFGIVLVEAMSAGTLVIASNLGAFRRVLNEGEYGLLFENGNSDELAQAILTSLADPQLRNTFIEQSKTGVRRYDWSTVGEEIVTVYTMASAGSQRVEIDPASGSGWED